jgi:hypothetical protein
MNYFSFVSMFIIYIERCRLLRDISIIIYYWIIIVRIKSVFMAEVGDRETILCEDVAIVIERERVI